MISAYPAALNPDRYVMCAEAFESVPADVLGTADDVDDDDEEKDDDNFDDDNDDDDEDDKDDDDAGG